MNPESSQWPPLVAGAGDDFSFLEFPDLNVDDFPPLDNPTQPGDNPADAQLHSEAEQASHSQRPRSAGPDASGGLLDGLKDGVVGHPHGMEGVEISPAVGGLNAGRRNVSDAQLMMRMRQQQQHQQQHHHQHSQQPHVPFHAQAAAHFYGQGRVPPTPNSMELHGAHRHFPVMDQHAQAVYETYRKQQEQMIFTPLVSPAVTPLDQDFHMPEYAIPGEYFSPLTSPALHAQNHAAHQHSQHPQQRSAYQPARSEQSETISPVEMSFDTTFETSYTTPPAKKSKRKPTSTAESTSGKVTTAQAVRQSPAMKGQRRRPTSTTSAGKPPRRGSAAMAAGAKAGLAPSQALRLPQTQSRPTSETSDSLSPEPFLDASSRTPMPPPAAPRSASAGRSPYLSPQAHGQTPRAANTAPVTPAVLMNIAKSNTDPAALRCEGSIQPMADLALPEPAVSTTDSTPKLHPLNTQVSGSSQDPTPTGSARPMTNGTATTTGAHSIPPSPAVGSATSPNSGATAKGADFKVPAKGGKKKRNSSSQPSPALRPKISPSIKPLLPEGTPLNAETSALLLASKSNYQNILEGTHLPGVSYPETLSENLTSKRTSHKIAEQGRRNRINHALQEMSALLPPPPASSAKTTTSVGSDGSPGGNATPATSSQSQSNSKATTVEMAIEYIKALQAELKDVKGKLNEAEGKLAAKDVD